jgi:DNA-binding MarR family transcriptional regulator
VTGTQREQIRRVQRAYPQIYLACHVRHTTAAAEHGLSERDARVLAHLDELSPVGAGALARHLGVAASTLTEALDRLETLGLVTRTRARKDRRGVDVRITEAGIEKMQAGSVLDTRRLASVLARIPARDRPTAVRGIELIARAARDLMISERKRR